MGCTSSAQSTNPPNAHTADKSIQSEEDLKVNPSIEVAAAAIDDANGTNETVVLPPRDNFEHTVHLVRNNKSSNSLANDKEVPANGHIIESENVIKTPENTQQEVKIPKLELLMDKVFETNHHLNESEESEKTNSETVVETVERTERSNETTDNTNEPESSNTTETELDINIVEEEREEVSPSQSQCSRATRWEALADIAAELPPSLAVDPLTGQIYQIGLHK